MSADVNKVIAEAAAAGVQDVLSTQPWWKKSSNTVTMACTGVVSALSVILGAGLDLPNSVRIAMGVTVAFLGVFATKATKNGTTVRGSEAVVDAVKQRVEEALTPPTSTLDDLVRGTADAAAREAERIATEAATAAITRGPAALPGVIVGGVADSAVGSAEAFLDMLKRGAR